MPTAPLVATFPTTAHPYTLTVDGLDVVRDPGSSGMGTRIETVTVTEAGPGGVSSIVFRIDDPPKGITIPDGAPILFWDNTANVPIFRGWVDTWAFRPDFGQGRTIEVQGVGVEILLDWMLFDEDSVGFGAGGITRDIARLATLMGGPLRAIAADVSSTLESSQALPISTLSRIGADATILGALGSAQLLPTGQTLRQMIQTYYDMTLAQDNQEAFGATQALPVMVTVDFYYGLRIWRDYPGIIPSDYTNMTIVDTTAGALVASDPTYRVDPSQIVRRVYVKGFDAASSGSFVDGSGIQGRRAYVSDVTITTAEMAARSARNVFGLNSVQVRGRLELQDFTPTATVHTGSFVTITDANLGLSAQSFRIMEIEKTFNGSGRQNWLVSFGSLAPSVTNYVRQLTRNVLR